MLRLTLLLAIVSSTSCKSVSKKSPPPVSALSIRQQEYLDNIRDDNVRLVFGLGSAGSGKTYLACKGSGEQPNYNNIIVTKPFVSVSKEEIGFLPGSVQQKVSPWVESILSNFDSGTRKQVHFAPMGFMRGHSFINTIIIADEMQNSTPEQMLMLLTRIGSNSKMIVTGDLMQKDISGLSGIEDFLNRFTLPSDKIKITKFNAEDVQRDDFTKDILRLYSKEETRPKQSVLSMYKYILSADDNNDAAMIPKSQI